MIILTPAEHVEIVRQMPGPIYLTVEGDPCPNDCTRFDGKVPGHIYGSNWPWVPCQTCMRSMFVAPSRFVEARDRVGMFLDVVA